MAAAVDFTRNYSDLSTEHGFQFEFFCDRCGNGQRTRFKPFSLGMVNGAIDAASSLFGGILGQAADLSGRATEARRQQAREEAYIEAVRELKPNFVQCPRCSSWVCRKSCWNEKRGLCKECAPDLGVSMFQQYKQAIPVSFTVHCSLEDSELLFGSVVLASS